jgi:hypothetical protein
VELLNEKKVSENVIFPAKYLQVSQKSDNFAAENDKKENYVNVECILLRLLLLLCKQL